MSKADRDLLLEAIEDDFRQDLAVHLYSSHLLHAINPYFPRKNWLSWPLSLESVPDPRNTSVYADEPVVDYGDSGNRGRPSAARTSHESKKDLSKYRIRSVTTTQQASDPRACVMTEIKALVDHRIHSLIQQNPRIRSAMEVRLELVGKLCIEIADGLDDVLSAIADVVHSRNQRASKSETERTVLEKQEHSHALNTQVRRLNWQDVLLAAESVKQTPEGLYKRCETLFHNADFPYEYDSEKELGSAEEAEASDSQHEKTSSPASSTEVSEDNSDLTSEDEDSETESSDKSSSSDTSPDPSSHQQLATSTASSPKAFQNIHLDRLTHLNPRLNRQKIEQKIADEKSFSESKKNLFYHKKRIRYNYSSVEWALKRPKKIVYKIEGRSLEETRQLAIEHGGVGLDAEDYLE